MSIDLNERELAAVLAALRYWQRDLAESDSGPISPEHFADATTPLTVEEIDSLCQILNCESAV